MSTIKRLLKSGRVRVSLGIAIISIAVIAVFLSPYKEPSDPNIELLNNPNPVTVVVTNPIGTLNVQRGVHYKQETLTVTNVQEAGAFSDDRKKAGKYIVRVNVHVLPDSSLQSPLPVDYASLVRLILPNGQSMAPSLINLEPVTFPGKSQAGYFDFAFNAPVTLSGLSLKLNGEPALAFN